MTIPELVADLTAAPRPVVCLDTCVLFDLLRAGWREPVEELQAAARLRVATNQPVPAATVVLTYLVPVEFGQNLAEVQREATNAVARLERLVEAADVLRRPTPRPNLSDPSTLVDELTRLAQDLIAAAGVIDRDQGCVDRALDRVTARTKPAANGRVKDAIHLEHYLALSRAIGAAGLPCPRAFVSSNRADFDDPVLVATDFAPAGLRYFPRLAAAVGAFNI